MHARLAHGSPQAFELKIPFSFGSSCSGSSGERRAVAVVAPRFEAVSRLWVLTGLKHQPPVFSRLPVQHGKGGSSQTASGLCLVRHSTCLKLALLVETNPCFLVQNFLGFWALQKRPFSSCKSTAKQVFLQSGARQSGRVSSRHRDVTTLCFLH